MRKWQSSKFNPTSPKKTHCIKPGRQASHLWKQVFHHVGQSGFGTGVRLRLGFYFLPWFRALIKQDVSTQSS